MLPNFLGKRFDITAVGNRVILNLLRCCRGLSLVPVQKIWNLLFMNSKGTIGGHFSNLVRFQNEALFFDLHTLKVFWFALAHCENEPSFWIDDDILTFLRFISHFFELGFFVYVSSWLAGNFNWLILCSLGLG